MSSAVDFLRVKGRFEATLYEYIGGPVIWKSAWSNTVVTVGKNILISTLLTGSAYTVTGPYMGLITATGFSAISASDTMASHTGWSESTTYGSTRPTMSFSAASGGSITTSAAVNYTSTGTDTIEGAFVVLGSGASNVEGNTGGTLFSAGTFSATQPWVSGNTLAVTYTLSV